MKRLAVLCLLALLAGLSVRLAAQDYTIKKVTFIPATYHVGDPVELRIAVRSDFADKMVVPQQLSQPSWGSIDSLRLKAGEGEAELRLLFTSFAVGTRSLPAINLGPVVLEGINVYITSLVPEGEADLAALRGPLLVSGVWWRLALQALAALALPLAAIATVFWALPLVRRRVRARREALPFRRFQKNLRLARPGLDGLPALDFYDWLLGAARAYLAERCRFPALAMTGPELEAALASRVHHRETVDRLAAVFVRAARVKYGGEPAGPQSRQTDLAAVEQALGHIEQEERMRRNAEAADAPEAVRDAGMRLGARVREGLRRPEGGNRVSL
jgi:hypothetical protein